MTTQRTSGYLVAGLDALTDYYDGASIRPTLQRYRGSQMPALTHAFAVYVTGLAPGSAFTDRLYEAGCDDATIVMRDGELHLGFDREAPAFSDAVGSAMHDIELAGGRIVRVERISG